MANGGIIGPVQEPVIQSELVTTFNSSGTLTTQPETTTAHYLVVAGGGGGEFGGTGAAGGSGVVIIKEPEIKTAPGVWSINSVYEYVKEGTWTN